MPYEQIKQIGKRHIESVCIRTCQSGSKGNWRFPRKCKARFSQVASHRGILSSWHLVQETNDQTKKHQKLGGNCIANSGLLLSPAQSKAQFQSQAQVIDVFTTNFPNFLLEGQGSQMNLPWISVMNPTAANPLQGDLFSAKHLFFTLSTVSPLTNISVYSLELCHIEL